MRPPPLQDSPVLIGKKKPERRVNRLPGVLARKRICLIGNSIICYFFGKVKPKVYFISYGFCVPRSNAAKLLSAHCTIAEEASSVKKA